MENLKNPKVEKVIVDAIKEVKDMLKLDVSIDGDVCPGDIGISSQVLITVMGRVSNILGVSIPDNCYIFHDNETQQLSIKEAAQKLINVAKDGK